MSVPDTQGGLTVINYVYSDALCILYQQTMCKKSGILGTHHIV